MTAALRSRTAADVQTGLRSRALWFYGLVWLVAALILLLTGHASSVGIGAAYLIAISILSLITFRVSQPDTLPFPPARGRIGLQLAVIVALILLTAYDGLVFHNVVSFDIPLWIPLHQALEGLGSQWLSMDNAVVNPTLYFVIPLIMLLLLGAKPGDLGLNRGQHVGRVALVWCALPLLILLFLLLSGQLTLERIIRRLFSNFMQNGFFEEFLFRGALQTRLRSYMRPAWALVIQALVFGLWHLGLGFTNMGDANLLTAAASTIMIQATLGLAFGLIFERTRNLFASSAFHILLNSIW